MWKSVYLAALGVAVVVTGFFMYYAWSWLQSIGDPRMAWDGFNYHRDIGKWTLIISTALLIVIGNAVLWSTRKAWALWSSHLFFTVFAILVWVVLRIVGARFCQENDLCVSPSSFLTVVIAIGSITVVGAIVYFDQMLVTRMHTRMYDEKEAEPVAADLEPETENSRDQDPES